MPENSTSNLRRAWYVLGVLMFAYIVAFLDRMVLGLLVQPIKRDLGVTDTQVGLLAGLAFGIFYTIMGVPLARLADRTNRKWLIAVGAALWTLMTAASAFADSYRELFIARIGVGIGEATLTPAAMSMIADYFPRDRLARAMGVYSTGLYFGTGAALLAGSAVIEAVTNSSTVAVPLLGTFSTWQVAFLVVAVPGLLVIVLMMTVHEPPRRELVAGGGPLAPDAQPLPIGEILRFMRTHARLLSAHFSGFCFLGTATVAYLVWAPEMIRRTWGLSITEAGVLYGVLLATFGALAPFAGGRLAELLAKRGHADSELRAAILGAAALTPLVIVVPLLPGAAAGTVLLAPLTFLLAMPQGMPSAVLQLVAPNRMRAQLLATYILIAVLAAYALGPTLVPLCSDRLFGSPAALNRGMALVCGVLVPLGALCLAIGLKPYRELMLAHGRKGR